MNPSLRTDKADLLPTLICVEWRGSWTVWRRRLSLSDVRRIMTDRLKVKIRRGQKGLVARIGNMRKRGRDRER